MMLSAQNILQAFNTMPEDQQQKILDTIQQENRIEIKILLAKLRAQEKTS